jgi:hypothetical protein
MEAFISAARKGDMDGLEDLFTDDAVSYSDGGGHFHSSYIFRSMSCGLAADDEINPDACNDSYMARSAANQSTSGEPSGIPLPIQCW